MKVSSRFSLSAGTHIKL
jgi:hypothetical protein